MSQRTLILSDTHLGRPRCAAVSADALRPLWAKCTHLILNGDVAEVHHPTHWSQAARQTLHLFDLCENDGVHLTLLSGNHDPFISDLRHLHLAHEEVFVTHGDVMHPAVAPWSPRAGRMRERYEQAMAALPPDQRDRLEAMLSVSQAASHAEWDQLQDEAGRSTVSRMLMRPWAIGQVLWYWRAFPHVAARFMVRHTPRSRFAILGHTHRPGIWTIDNRIIINTGSFGFPGKPRAVTIDDDRLLQVWAIEYTGNEYRLATKPLQQFELRRDAPSRHAHAAAANVTHEQTGLESSHAHRSEHLNAHKETVR